MKRSWLGALLGMALAACSVTHDEPVTDSDELNENKVLGMTDVTILYPLPKSWEFFDDMLGPSSEDAQGELLPASLFAPLADMPAPPMVGPDGSTVDPQKKLFAQWADSFAYLRVVGVRLDPCFGESSNLDSPSCLNTIRMTAQFFFPRAQANSNAPIADQRAGVHLFYKVSRADFTELAKQMLALRQSTGLPLQKGLITPQTNGVHPTMAAEGLRGPYANALKALLLKYAGEKTLARVAFAIEDRGAPNGGNYYQQNQNPDTRWVFGGFEYGGGRFSPMNIAALGAYTGLQTIDSVPRASGTRDGMVVVNPAISIPDNLLQTFNMKPEANGQLDPAKMEAARKAARKLQNPTSYTTHNADCASCHMAKQAVRNGPADELDFKSYTFRLDHSNDVLGPFRMFGYDNGNNPVISTRVVNETAVVLEYLNKYVLH